MNLRVKSLGGVFALSCGLIFVIAIWPACACVPMEYREVAVDSLPEDVRANADEVEPGIRSKRAWAFGASPLLRSGHVAGYLIRGRTPGSWWDRDFKLHVARSTPAEESIELRPIDGIGPP